MKMDFSKPLVLPLRDSLFLPSRYITAPLKMETILPLKTAFTALLSVIPRLSVPDSQNLRLNKAPIMKEMHPTKKSAALMSDIPRVIPVRVIQRI